MAAGGAAGGPPGERYVVFKGRLRVAGDPGEGIPVDLLIDDVYVDLVADGEMLGRWRMDVVEISRLAGNEFAVVLDGEQMVFASADPLAFAYNAVTTVEEIASRLRKKRGLFRRRPDGTRRPASDTDDESTTTMEPPPVALDDLLPSTPDVERLLPPPPEQPVAREISIEVEPVVAVESVAEDMVEVQAVEWVDDDGDVPVAAAEEIQVDDLIPVDDVAAAPVDVVPAPAPRERQQPPPATPSVPPPHKRRLFGRGRGDETHTHDYSESKTVGGITRRVCSHCGHVSFAGEDVYQDWT